MKTGHDHGNRRAPQREPPCTLVLIVWGEPGGTCSLFLSVHQTVIRRQARGRRSRPSATGIPRHGIDWSLTTEIMYAWARRNKTETRWNIILTFPLRTPRSTSLHTERVIDTLCLHGWKCCSRGNACENWPRATWKHHRKMERKVPSSWCFPSSWLHFFLAVCAIPYVLCRSRYFILTYTRFGRFYLYPLAVLRLNQWLTRFLIILFHIERVSILLSTPSRITNIFAFQRNMYRFIFAGEKSVQKSISPIISNL